MGVFVHALHAADVRLSRVIGLCVGSGSLNMFCLCNSTTCVRCCTRNVYVHTLVNPRGPTLHVGSEDHCPLVRFNDRFFQVIMVS